MTDEAPLDKLASTPLVSVITIVKNGSKHIRDAIESVLSQDYAPIEYIVIDGQSSDGTQSIIQEYAEQLSYYLSEPDKGISDAWNKGVRAAKGEYIAFLNADDYYHPGFIRRSIAASKRDNAEIIYGITLLKDEEDETRSVIVDQAFDPSRIKFGFGFLHPSCLMHRSLFDSAGFFDEGIRIACDSEFLLRCLKCNVSFRKSDGLVIMRTGGVSDRQWMRAAFEYLFWVEKHGFISHSEYRLQRMVVLIRYVNKKFHLMNHIRSVKDQLYYIGMFLINLLNKMLPFKARALLYRFCGYKVHPTAVIHGGVRFFHVGRLTVGGGTVINSGVYLDNRKYLEIGSNVSISHDVKIYTLGHEINNDIFSIKGKSVVIQDYSVVFAGAMIMPGVTVNKAGVVMSGSVVTRDVPAFGIVGGNPATLIGMRDSHPAYRFTSRRYFAI
jgi:glycosyltransferase involved in cell wall biosynthesis